MKVYLAGGMQDGWQDRFSADFELLDPRSWQDPDPVVYTARDLAAIRDADAVLAYMDSANPSGYGLSLEVGFAHALGKPVVFVDVIGADWRSRYFGMVRSVSTVVRSIDDALIVLEHISHGL